MNTNTSKNYSRIKILLILFFPLFIFIFSTYFLKIYFHHDALAGFESFKFINDYYFKYNEIPLWIPNLANGVNISSKIIIQGYQIIAPYAFVGKIFDINSYYIYILFIFLLYLIFFLGVCKLISILDIKNKSLSIYFSLYIIIFTNLFFNEIFFTIITNIFVPYYLYYFLKFQKNQKISELFKIVILYLLKSYIFYFYGLVIEFYFLVILSLYFQIYKINNFMLIFRVKNLKFFLLILLLTSLVFFNYHLFNENYILKDFTYRKETGSIFFDNYRFGDIHHLKIMFLSLISGFFWGEASYIFGFSGLFFMIYSLNNAKFFSKFSLYKFSIYIIPISIIFSNLWVFPNFIKYLYYSIPLLDYHSHSQYNYLYGKTFLLILILYGFDKFISQRFISKNIVINSIYIYLIIFIVSFFLSFVFTKFYPIEIIISANLYTLPFIGILVYLYCSKKKIDTNKGLVVFFLIISLLPSYIYNLTNYSFSNKVNFYKKNNLETQNIRKIAKRDYERLYFNRNQFNYEKGCLTPDNIFKKIPSVKIKEFIPRGSADYSVNIINLNNFQCSNFARINIIENKIALDDFDFDQNDFDFILKKNIYSYSYLKISDNYFQPILPFSKNFYAYDDKGNQLRTNSVKGFLNIAKNNVDNVTIKYVNYKIKVYLFFLIIFSIIVNYLILGEIKNFIKKLNKYTS